MAPSSYTGRSSPLTGYFSSNTLTERMHLSVRQEGKAMPGQNPGRGMFRQRSPSCLFASTLPTFMLRNGKTVSFLHMAILTIK